MSEVGIGEVNPFHRYPALSKAVLEAPLVVLDRYDFLAFPVGERGTTISHELITEVSDGLVSEITNARLGFNSIVSIHTTGSMWAILTAKELKKPLHNFVAEPSLTMGQVALTQTTGYRGREIYSPDLQQIDRPIIIDDVLSTGSTLVSLTEVMRDFGVEPQGIFCIIDKNNRAPSLGDELGMPVSALVDSSVIREALKPEF